MTHIISPPLTNRQKQFLTGTILGGSSLVKTVGSRNCYLSMRCKNKKWLEFKAGEIAPLASSTPFTSDTTHRWHSMCYPTFNALRKEFYTENKRELKQVSLDLLNDVAFAIWFGDVGSYRNQQITLNTHIWGENGSNLIINYFDQIGYKSDLIKERGSFRVKLDLESSFAFLKLAEPHLPVWFLQAKT
jgi:hypothetical protein